MEMVVSEEAVPLESAFQATTQPSPSTFFAETAEKQPALLI